MTLKAKLHGIMSLSAASMALLGMNSAEGDPSNAESNAKPNGLDKGDLLLKTNHLILAPPEQEKMLQLYAQHSSHASHASHASHYSGTDGTGGGDYSPPAPYTPPPAPVYPYYPPQRPAPVQPVAATNEVPQTDASGTNTPGTAAGIKSMEIADLKERAAKGSDTAQCILAFDYMTGDGVETNIEKATLLFEFSALQGNDLARKKFEELTAKAKEQEKSQK